MNILLIYFITFKHIKIQKKVFFVSSSVASSVGKFDWTKLEFFIKFLKFTILNKSNNKNFYLKMISVFHYICKLLFGFVYIDIGEKNPSSMKTAKFDFKFGWLSNLPHFIS